MRTISPWSATTAREEMTDFTALSIRVKAKELIVTLPGSNYAVTYFKRDDCPGLFAKNIIQVDDPRLPQTAAQFLAKAWKLANQKATELGWIKRKCPPLPATLDSWGNSWRLQSK